METACSSKWHLINHKFILLFARFASNLCYVCLSVCLLLSLELQQTASEEDFIVNSLNVCIFLVPQYNECAMLLCCCCFQEQKRKIEYFRSCRKWVSSLNCLLFFLRCFSFCYSWKCESVHELPLLLLSSMKPLSFYYVHFIYSRIFNEKFIISASNAKWNFAVESFAEDGRRTVSFPASRQFTLRFIKRFKRFLSFSSFIRSVALNENSGDCLIHSLAVTKTLCRSRK